MKMQFIQQENNNNETIILVHGGGLSWWSYEEIGNKLKTKYNIVYTIIDGHAGNTDSTFISIEDSAKKLSEYINLIHNGKVFALIGLSVGAQIIIELLSVNKDIARYAVIESALVFPLKIPAWLIRLSINSSYFLIRKSWFSKQQAKALSLPDTIWGRYFEDSSKISKETLINLSLSNQNYHLKDKISDTLTNVLIIAGGKEPAVMKRSATHLHRTIPGSKLYIAKGMKHGELSLLHPDLFLEIIEYVFHNSNDFNIQ